MNKLAITEFKNQRILTTAQLAESYETTDRRISENFNANKDRYQEGKHFYYLEGEALAQFKNQYGISVSVADRTARLYLWTEKGCLHHAKSLGTEKAWEVFEMLEETYFRVKEIRDSYMIENPIERATRWIEEQKEVEVLLLGNKQKDQLIGELKPRADYTDNILKNKGLVTITQITKDYGMSAQKMNVLLHELKIQFKQSEQWLLYAEHHDKGYTQSETIAIVRSDGRGDVKMNTKWTQKGRLFLYNLLKGAGVLPVIEH